MPNRCKCNLRHPEASTLHCELCATRSPKTSTAGAPEACCSVPFRSCAVDFHQKPKVDPAVLRQRLSVSSDANRGRFHPPWCDPTVRALQCQNKEVMFSQKSVTPKNVHQRLRTKWLCDSFRSQGSGATSHFGCSSHCTLPFCLSGNNKYGCT